MKYVTRLYLIICTILITSASGIYAQNQTNSFQVGAGLVYGSDVEEIGVQANVNYPVMENVELAPDLSIYWADQENGIDNFWELNLNGHYFFSRNEQYNVYGLGGLNIATFGYNLTDDSDTEAGINLGVGSEYYLNAFTLYGELKYVIGSFDQLVLGAGVRIPF